MTITILMILNTVLLWFSVASFLSLVAKIDALEFGQIATCRDTEICFLEPNQSPNITCSCSESQCSWSKFADRGNILSNGPVLMWQRTGYGQYICRNGSTVARNIMILPGREEIKTLLYGVYMIEHLMGAWLYFYFWARHSEIKEFCKIVIVSF